VNKRSAVAVAAGLTGALVSGVAGYSVRVGSSAAEPGAAPPLPPIVKHKTKTITIHRKAKPAALITKAPAVQTVVVRRAPTVIHPAPPAPAPRPAVHHTGGSGTGTGGEHETEHEGGSEHEGAGGDD